MNSHLSECAVTGNVNVAKTERHLSGALGGLILLTSLGGSGLQRLAALGLGAALIYRGYTGHCYAYEALGVDTACGDSKAVSKRNGDAVGD
jgi:uncharacterized membrane protein